MLEATRRFSTRGHGESQMQLMAAQSEAPLSKARMLLIQYLNVLEPLTDAGAVAGRIASNRISCLSVITSTAGMVIQYFALGVAFKLLINVKILQTLMPFSNCNFLLISFMNMYCFRNNNSQLIVDISSSSKNWFNPRLPSFSSASDWSDSDQNRLNRFIL